MMDKDLAQFLLKQITVQSEQKFEEYFKDLGQYDINRFAGDKQIHDTIMRISKKSFVAGWQAAILNILKDS